MNINNNGYNEITKNDALEFMQGKSQDYIVNKLIQTTLYGMEYQDNTRYGALEMSYFCRAFNITALGATKQTNRIKNRYKKYQNVEGLEDYYRQLLYQNWPGFPSEKPRMDDLLAQFAAGGVQEEEEQFAEDSFSNNNRRSVRNNNVNMSRSPRSQIGYDDQDGWDDGNGMGQNPEDKKELTIGIIIAAILIFIFRKQLAHILPYIIVIGLIVLVIWAVKNGKINLGNVGNSIGANRGGKRRARSGGGVSLNLSAGRVVGAVFMWIIAIGGLKNGAADNIGSLLVAIGLLVGGVALLVKKN